MRLGDNHRHHRRHHLANMQLSPLLTRSGLTRLEVSLMVSPGSFCLLACSFEVFSVICYGAFCLHVVIISVCILVFCPKLGLCLVLLQTLCLFYNLSNCILPFFSHISFLLLFYFLRLSLDNQFYLSLYTTNVFS